MHPNFATLENLYGAFARLDANAMATCYAPDAMFDDEAFSLRGHEQVTGMWHMLCDGARAKSADVWRLHFGSMEADALRGKAHWEAHYRFSATGRMVHNVIEGLFEFDEAGLIRRHRDKFNFWAWSRQALGVPGVLLGWTPLMRAKVRSTAARNLQKFMAQQKHLTQA